MPSRLPRLGATSYELTTQLESFLNFIFSMYIYVVYPYSASIKIIPSTLLIVTLVELKPLTHRSFKMPTTIYFVRHAQGFHNLNQANHSIPDPLLTKHGESQCATLAASFPHTDRITHLVASPLRRTILTALLSFPSLVEPPKSLKVIAVPELQETSDLPCDTGSAPEVLEHEYAGKVDLSRVKEGWNHKGPEGPWSPAPEKVEARAAVSRRFLRELGQEYEERTGEDAHIAVVTHGGLLHFATEDWTGFKKLKGTGWENTEWRYYVFGEGEKKESLVETGKSCKRRAGSEIPLTADEEREFNAVIGGAKESL